MANDYTALKAQIDSIGDGFNTLSRLAAELANTTAPANTDNYTGCDELRAWLTAQGWAIYADTLSRGRECNWYAARKTVHDARECETNDGKRMQVCVWPSRLWDGTGAWWEAASVEVTGEAGGIWYTVKAYSLRHDEMMARLPQIEASLIDAWNALGMEKVPA